MRAAYRQSYHHEFRPQDHNAEAPGLPVGRPAAAPSGRPEDQNLKGFRFTRWLACGSACGQTPRIEGLQQKLLVLGCSLEWTWPRGASRRARALRPQSEINRDLFFRAATKLWVLGRSLELARSGGRSHGSSFFNPKLICTHEGFNNSFGL